MLKKLLVIAITFSLLSCNFLEEMGDKDTDDARLFRAKEYINAGEYSEAITEFEAMTTGFREKREVVVLYASAHAGVCGLDFLNLLEALKGISTDKLFTLFMKTYTGATEEKIEHCITAQDIVQNITENATDRSADENLFMAFIAFAKMGSIFATYADADANDTLDSGFDACSTGDIPDLAVREVGSSLVHVFASLKALDDVSGIGDGQLTSISTVLDAIDAAADFCDDTPDGSGNCQNTDPADFSPAELKIFRSFMNENAVIGLGSCNGNVVTCVCI